MWVRCCYEAMRNWDQRFDSLDLKQLCLFVPKPQTRRIRGENAERALELSLDYESVAMICYAIMQSCFDQL